MTTVQNSLDIQRKRETGNFATMLRGYTRAAGLTYEELAEAAQLPLDTLLNWLKGRVQRPRNWRDVAQVARALHLGYAQADALLRAATHPSLALLKQAHPDEAVLAEWRIPPPPPCDDMEQRARRVVTLQRPPLKAQSHTDELTRALPLGLSEQPGIISATPDKQRRIPRAAVVAAITAGLLLTIAGFVIWLNNIPPVNGQGWSIIGPLDIAPLAVAPDGRRYIVVNQIVTATARLRNNNSQTTTILLFGVAARGPDGCEKNWAAGNYDFPAVSAITEPPNGEYLYQRSVSFTQPGVYFAEPGEGDGKGHGGGVAPYPRVWFTVTADPNNLPPPDCLTPIPAFQYAWSAAPAATLIATYNTK